jgi:hypothetical protein
MSEYFSDVNDVELRIRCEAVLGAIVSRQLSLIETGEFLMDITRGLEDTETKEQFFDRSVKVVAELKFLQMLSDILQGQESTE